MLYQRPLDEISRWPAWQLRLLEHYLARDPAPVEKVEYIIAQLTAIYHNAHQKEGAAQKTAADYLPFAKAWPGVIDLDEYQQTLRDLE